jgi:hypothetical protein
MAVRQCRECRTDITTRHKNALDCAACRQDKARNPRSHLTPEQQAHILRLRGTMRRMEIAAVVDVSQAQVNRFLREQALRSNVRDYSPEEVQMVCAAYAVLGKVRTQALFPQFVVRSIVERYYKPQGLPPRQERWMGEQLIDAARMAGLVSHTAQARFFARPNAYNGSIRSLWQKWFRCAPIHVHGLPLHLGWAYVRPGTTATLVAQQSMPGPRCLLLWLDMAGHLRPDVEPWVVAAIHTLARFQAWLTGTTDTESIRAMITTRESEYGYHNRSRDEWDDQDDPGATADAEARGGAPADF